MLDRDSYSDSDSQAELINRIDASFLDEDSWRELNESLREYKALIRPSS